MNVVLSTNNAVQPTCEMHAAERRRWAEDPYGMKDVTGSLRRQLNAGLLLAMKAKDTVAVSTLRSVMSALDNASAVPASTVAAPVFGRNGDVPRRDLSDSDCQSVVSARSAAAEEYTRLGRDDAAARLRADQAVVERYVTTSGHAQQSVATGRGEDAAPAER